MQKLVHEQVDSVFGDDTMRDPTEDDLRKMPYLERCIKESLRLVFEVPRIIEMASRNIKTG